LKNIHVIDDKSPLLEHNSFELNVLCFKAKALAESFSTFPTLMRHERTRSTTDHVEEFISKGRIFEGKFPKIWNSKEIERLTRSFLPLLLGCIT